MKSPPCQVFLTYHRSLSGRTSYDDIVLAMAPKVRPWEWLFKVSPWIHFAQFSFQQHVVQGVSDFTAQPETLLFKRLFNEHGQAGNCLRSALHCFAHEARLKRIVDEVKDNSSLFYHLLGHGRGVRIWMKSHRRRVYNDIKLRAVHSVQFQRRAAEFLAQSLRLFERPVVAVNFC